MKLEQIFCQSWNWRAWILTGAILVSACLSAWPGVLWQEGWERTPLGAYVPKCGPSPILGDGGSWDLGDTVSCSSDCGRTQNRANIIMDAGSKALNLVTTTNSGGCAENIFLGRGGLAIPVTAGTYISFAEHGQLENPQKYWGFNCIMPPCADNTHIWLQDNRGYVVVYVFQRPENYTEHTFGKGDKANYNFGYTEVFLPTDGGAFTRDLLEDFKRIPRFPVTGAKVNSIKIEVSSLGWATFDGLRIEHVSQTPPIIKVQPVSRTVTAGKSLQLAVQADGFPPLQYQWWHDGTEIPGATNAVWSVSAASSVDSGDYQAVVSNIYGQTLSAVARVTVVPDVTKPTLAILTPPASVYRVTNSAVAMSGTARDDVGVVDVVIEPDGEPGLHASGTTNWTALLDLHPGTNIFRVHATDAAGNASVATTRRIFRVVTAPLVCVTNGAGVIRPDLNGQWLELGQSYTLVARASSGSVFSNWTDVAGVVLSNGPTLRFVMQSNLVLHANFVPNPFLALKGAYVGLFQPSDDDALAPTNAGALALTLTDRGRFSGSVRLTGRSHAISGVFDLARRAVAGIRRPGNTPLTLNLVFDAQTITGQISAAGWIADALAVRRATITSNAFAGRYSMLVMGRHDADNAPPGDSALAVSVTGPSAVSVSGTMADGSPVTVATGHSDTGLWPCYASLNSGRRVMLGWLTCATNSATQELLWVKPTVAADRFYQAGFRERRDVAVQRYYPPASRQSPTTWTQGHLLVGGGNLATPLEAEVLVTNNLVKRVSGTLSNLSLTITTSNGRFGGSFAHPVTRKATQLRGILVQGLPWMALPEQVTVGGGWFVGTNEGGWLWLEPKP